MYYLTYPTYPPTSPTTHHFHPVAVLQIPHARHNHLFTSLQPFHNFYAGGLVTLGGEALAGLDGTGLGLVIGAEDVDQGVAILLGENGGAGDNDSLARTGDDVAAEEHAGAKQVAGG